ncbi:MAG: hypothetical protein AAF724_00250 [Pseudomonadota bacterium]
MNEHVELGRHRPVSAKTNRRANGRHLGDVWIGGEPVKSGKDIEDLGRMARSIGFTHEEALEIEKIYQSTLKKTLK